MTKSKRVQVVLCFGDEEYSLGTRALRPDEGDAIARLARLRQAEDVRAGLREPSLASWRNPQRSYWKRYLCRDDDGKLWFSRMALLSWQRTRRVRLGFFGASLRPSPGEVARAEGRASRKKKGER